MLFEANTGIYLRPISADNFVDICSSLCTLSLSWYNSLKTNSISLLSANDATFEKEICTDSEDNYWRQFVHHLVQIELKIQVTFIDRINLLLWLTVESLSPGLWGEKCKQSWKESSCTSSHEQSFTNITGIRASWMGRYFGRRLDNKNSSSS